MYWFYGFLTSLLIGQLATGLFLTWVRESVLHGDELKKKNKKDKWWVKFGLQAYPKTTSPDVKELPPIILGMIERLFFTLIIAFDISGAAIAMITWISVKMYTSWFKRIENNKELYPFALSALLGGIVSMLFALIGGLIIQKGIGCVAIR